MLVHRVAAEAAAELVVQAAANHALQGEGGHVQGLTVRLVCRLGGGIVAQQELQVRGVRELGRLPEAAVRAVEAAGELGTRLFQESQVGNLANPGGCESGQGVHQGPVLLPYRISLLSVGCFNLLKQAREGRQTVPGLVREIGAGEEGMLIVRGEEHGQGPAARRAGPAAGGRTGRSCPGPAALPGPP